MQTLTLASIGVRTRCAGCAAAHCAKNTNHLKSLFLLQINMFLQVKCTDNLKKNKPQYAESNP